MPRVVSKIKDNKGVIHGLAEGLRLSARNPDINKYTPHEKQRLFHKSYYPGRLFLGGNRSGKTVGGACEVVWYATGKHPLKTLPWKPPLRIRVVTVDLVQGLEKIVLPEIKRWMPKSELINGSWEDSYDSRLRTLTLANGSFIEFLTYEQDLEKFAGTSRHAIWFDEEPPHDIFVECKLRLLDTEGHWWITMTPVEGMTWTFEELYEKQSSLVEVIEVDMDENPHLSEAGKAMALEGLTKEEVAARKHGQFISLGGLIYPEFNPGVHVLQPHLPPVGSLQVAAMDSGYTNATAWLWAYVNELGQIVVFDEHYKTQTIAKDHAAVVHRKNLEHGLALGLVDEKGNPRARPPEYNVGDPSIRNVIPTTGTSVLIEYMECGIPILLGNNDVRAGIDRVKKLIVSNRLFITSNCKMTLWEIKRYRWAVWKHKNDMFDKNKKEEPQKKDDHAMDALRYLVASRPQVEDGRTIPKGRPMSVESSTAVEPDKAVYDDDLKKLGSNKNLDEHLGLEV